VRARDGARLEHTFSLTGGAAMSENSSSCACGGNCGCGGHSHQERYLTREEYIARLEQYLVELKAEILSVENELVELRQTA
jgi:hypothetical protein